MQETKVTLIYFGLSLFAFLALVPWILNVEIGMMAIKALAIYGGIVIAFLGGFIWGWDDQQNNSLNLWYAIGFSLTGLSIALLASFLIAASLLLLIASLHIFLYFESSKSPYYQSHIKYADARNLITNLVTICCITSLAFIFNPYT
jgi:putative flippase GtrA|tara:strand:+ start:742 stop:1179 length:438 start_codon:yes stop_codon:yes gene_type:complete